MSKLGAMRSSSRTMGAIDPTVFIVAGAGALAGIAYRRHWERAQAETSARLNISRALGAAREQLRASMASTTPIDRFAED